MYTPNDRLCHHTHSRLNLTLRLHECLNTLMTRQGELKNTGENEWTLITTDGKQVQVPIGRSVPLKHGLTIRFGSAEGRLLSK